jgi:cytochrome c oxidase accessory protein FixG
VDCHQCVVVCPTGIDIRNGTQLECINCTACIDACDSVMDKVDLPRGLIRYASYNAIAAGSKKIFTTRVIAYSVVLAVIIGVLGYLFASRSDVDATVLRAPGSLYLTPASGTIRNQYTIRVVNKTREALPIRLELLEPAGTIELVGGGAVEAEPGALAESSFFIDIAESGLTGMKTDVRIGVYSGDRLLEEVHTNFMGPAR